MTRIHVTGKPKPRQSVKSRVIFRKGGVQRALLAIRRGSSEARARAAILGSFFVDLYQPTSSNPWRKQIERAADAARFDLIPKGEAVDLVAHFRLPRPACHYGTGRNAAKLKASAPAYPVNSKTGDTTNLFKLAEDALNKRAFADDCQVCDIAATKRYEDPSNAPGVVIEVRRLEHAATVPA